MNEQNAERGYAQRAWELIQRGSTHAVAAGLFALPGFILTYLFVRSLAGFYLIGAVAMAAHATLRSLDADAGEDSEIDFSDYNQQQVFLFVSLIMAGAFVGVTAKLLVGMGIAAAVLSSTSDPALAITMAAIVPVLDRQMAEIDYKLSISSLSGVAVVSVLATALQLIIKSDRIFRELQKQKFRRFGPV